MFNIVTSEPLYEAPVFSVDGNDAFIGPNEQVTEYFGYRVMEQLDTQGEVFFLLADIMDRAGNTIDDMSQTTDESIVIYDSVLPTIEELTISSDNNFDQNEATSLAKSGDEISIEFYSSENIHSPNVTISGRDASVSGEDSSWIAVIEMIDEDAEGLIPLTVDYIDLAGNHGTQVVSITSGLDVTFDNTSPLISEVDIVSSNNVNTLAKVGDTITIALSSDEDLFSLSELEVVRQQAELEMVTNLSPTMWSFEYIMTETDTEGDVDFRFTANDLTGNFSTISEQNTGSVVFDRTKPVLTSVNIESNNDYDNQLAMSGDSIVINFTSNESVQLPLVTIGGESADVNGAAKYWTATRVMTENDEDGIIPFTIDFLDLASNDGIQVVSTTDDTEIRFDNTLPTLPEVGIASNNTFDYTLAKVGDDITITFSSSEIIQTPTVSIGYQEASVGGNGTGISWTAARNMVEDDFDGDVPFTIDFLDLAGNTGEQIILTTDSSGIVFDKIAPHLPDVTIESDNIYDISLAKIDDNVILSFTSNEAIQPPNVTIGGQDAEVSGDSVSWSAVRNYDEFIPDPDGVIEFSIDYLDLAGNFGSQVDSTTDESSVTFDRTLPEMTLIEIVSDNYYDSTLAMVADELTLIFTSSENIQAPPTVVIGDSIVSVSGFGTSWSAVRTMLSDDQEGEVVFSIDYLDMAGNPGIQNTESTNESKIIFDRTLPFMDIISMSSDNDYDPLLAKIADTTILSFTSSENIQAVSVTIDGDSAIVSGDGVNWTAAIEMDQENTESELPFTIDYIDLAGNVGIQDVITSDSILVRFDMTDPVVSDVFISSNNEYDSTLAMIGDTVFIKFISSEIAQVPDVLIGSRSAMVSGDGNNWLAVLEMDGTDIEGDIAFTIDYLDLAGNQGGQRLNTDDDSAVLLIELIQR